jgi:hypothetical protein
LGRERSPAALLVALEGGTAFVASIAPALLILGLDVRRQSPEKGFAGARAPTRTAVQRASRRLLAWERFLRRLQIRSAEGKRRPLLSFRHGFPAERLKAWQEAGANVQALVPHLAVYLGHVSPRETYCPANWGNSPQRGEGFRGRGVERKGTELQAEFHRSRNLVTATRAVALGLRAHGLSFNVWCNLLM